MPESHQPSDPTDILKRLSEGYRSVRLARGVVGKTGHAMIALLGVWGIIVWQLGDNSLRNVSLIFAGVVATLIFWWWTRSTQDFAQRNPAQALLDGAELLEYQKFEAQMKGLPSLPPSPSISDPLKPEPPIVEIPARRSDG
jgi:hypothetical protein